ncbi:succinate--CoA ligase subunit beta [candidate division WOR-3 bacterium JGI_Cruoil_03_44_89]|uniref:Succinate--CoA ligase [ADP-forming] subunit beta n=1 Tax=candidate division WOR-3 bacterium JGI_Cruoil_03_44_89 TaxID=1973748 RepID=A0A235BY07_UNCW3|nr:MAG: succinate--CoA ligase subunit beta [candidate division WOR-3 bacterium JGI_Cruoil_03_44_89]
MNLHEYQAKQIMREYGLPVQGGRVATKPKDAEKIARDYGNPVMVKAQVHTGGRGKAGGVKYAKTPDEAENYARGILGMRIKNFPVKKVLIAKAVDIKKEYYLSVIMDRDKKSPLIMASREGGMDIEEVARRKPKAIKKLWVDPVYGLLPHQAKEIMLSLFDDGKFALRSANIVEALYRLFTECDAQIAEINPLALDDGGKLWVTDAKVVLDDNALSRHPKLEKLRDPDPGEDKELAAKEAGLSYIPLSGYIGCVVNGAGLAMATMDLIKKYGGEPANFLDIGGSSSPEKVEKALSILLLDKNVRVIFFNIFGGITRCDDVASGVIRATESMKIGLPMVARLTGTNEDEARQILKNSPIIPVQSMSEGAIRAIELAKGN